MPATVEPAERSAADLRYRILGPLEVLAGSRPLHLGGARPRRVLAALLLRANRPVTYFQLAEAVWDGTPPDTARRQIQNAVAALRAVLGRVGAADAIVTRPTGYLLRVGPEQVDALAFEHLSEQARTLAQAGEHPSAAATLREALALWRGPVLAGLGGHLSEPAAARLGEQRLAALEEVIELQLAAGDHARLVSELRALVAEHPARGRFTDQLMVALYRAGRQAEALAAYHEVAGRLSGEFGRGPGPQLRQRYEMALREDPRLTAPARIGAGPGGTARLPNDVAAFTGRRSELAWLNQLIADGRSEAAVVISAAAGTAGVGTTALAVHWAHRVRDRFPDGPLYVDLHGYPAGPAIPTLDALARILGALGVPLDRVPTDVDEAAAMYRSLLADRRVLVVLDHARSPEQVRPLLPGNPGCLVLVTSRDQLGGLVALDGARRLTLGALSETEAVDLLIRLLGGGREASGPVTVRQIARACGYLPLALRLAAATLLGSPAQRTAAYAERLAASGRTGVRPVFDSAYAALPGPARRMFRLLARVPVTDVTPASAAALAGVGAEEAAPLLTRLARAHLLDVREPGRFAFHDELRRYAAELAAADGRPSGWSAAGV